MANQLFQNIRRRTTAPLCPFESDCHGVQKLDTDIYLRKIDHTIIRNAIDEYFAASGMPEEHFTTYFSPHERRWFQSASFLVEHRFKALGSAIPTVQEEQSRKIVEGVTMGMRIVKPTIVKPVMYLDWAYSGRSSQLTGFRKGAFEVYIHREERFLEEFKANDITLLATMVPRIRRTFIGHQWGSFNRIGNALNYFETGYRMNSAEMRFSLFATSLETLFVTSERSVSRQFRNRISHFLAQDEPEQQKLESSCRAIYKLRSMIVHGEPFDTGGPAELDQLMFEVQEIGRHSLQKVLRDEVLFSTFQRPRADLGDFLEHL